MSSAVIAIAASGATPAALNRFVIPLTILGVGLIATAFVAVASNAILPLLGMPLDRLGLKQKRKARVERLLREPTVTLLSIYVGSFAARTVVVLACYALARASGCDLMNALLLGVASGSAIAFLAGETVPRAMAMHTTARFASHITMPIFVLNRVCAPLASVLNVVTHPFAEKRGASSDVFSRAVVDERLKAMVDRGEVEGLLGERERETIDRILEFGRSTAGEIMLARPNMEGLPDTLTPEGLLQALGNTHHSRIPLYHESMDSVVGILHVKEQLLNQQTSYKTLLREPLFIPQSRALTDLLGDFQRRRMHLAIVVDEYGGTSGCVALSDLLQEIISVFHAEDEEEESAIRRVGDNRWIVQGSCEIAEFNETLRAELPDAMSRTVGGYVTAVLGRFPRQQETIVRDGLRITVLRMDAHRVSLLRIQRPSDNADDHDGHDHGKPDSKDSSR